ncbi:MAG: hypothetical protein WCF57_00705 [Pyrinomonadaceae bacterium]
MARVDAFNPLMPDAHLLRAKSQTCDVVVVPALVGGTNQQEAHFAPAKPLRINGLRIYLNAASANSFGVLAVFYSRREDGPYYRWRYEVGLEQWCFSRAHLSLMTRRALCLTCWEAIPTALQARLGEHYLD